MNRRRSITCDQRTDCPTSENRGWLAQTVFQSPRLFSPTVLKRVAMVSPQPPLVTVGFSFDDEPTVNSQDEQTVATSTICPVTHRPPNLPPQPRRGVIFTISGAVRTVISTLVASHLAQLDHQESADLKVGATPTRSPSQRRRQSRGGPVPALGKGTHEGCPYASWFSGNVHGGDGKASPYCERPFGHRGSGERGLHRRGSAGPVVRPLRCA